MNTKTCPICKKQHTKIKRTICQTCSSNRWRQNKKQTLVEYKGGKCEICGYDVCLRALTFHHKDPKEKDFTISGKHCLSIDKLKNEVDKCMLLCQNCHAEMHESIEYNNTQQQIIAYEQYDKTKCRKKRIIHTRKCKMCGVEFQTKLQSVFCSNKCYQQHRKS